MTSVIGHVYSLDFPAAYNSWDRVDPLELFDAQPVKMEANPKVLLYCCLNSTTVDLLEALHVYTSVAGMTQRLGF